MSNPEFVIRSSARKKQILIILRKEKYVFQSDLARKLNISVVTTKQHLNELLNLKLIKKDSSGKFVFYSLSTLGNDILDNLE